MKTFLFFMLIAVQSNAYTNNTISLSASVADKSESTTLSFQPTLPNLLEKLDFDLSIDAVRNRNQVNYNPSVDDFNIEKNALAAGIDLTWNHLITLGLESRSENVNQGEVKSSGVTSKLKFRLHDLVVRGQLTDLFVRQKDDFFVAGTNIKERMTLRNTRQTFGLAYYGFEALSLSMNYSKYSYDTDVVNLSSALSFKAVLLKSGAAFLSQIYSLIDHEGSLNLAYNLNDSLDLEIGFGESIDYFDPYVKSNDFRIGSTVYLKSFNVGGGVTAIKPTDADDALYSVDLTLSYNF